MITQPGMSILTMHFLCRIREPEGRVEGHWYRTLIFGSLNHVGKFANNTFRLVTDCRRGRTGEVAFLRWVCKHVPRCRLDHTPQGVSHSPHGVGRKETANFWRLIARPQAG